MKSFEQFNEGKMFVNQYKDPHVLMNHGHVHDRLAGEANERGDPGLAILHHNMAASHFALAAYHHAENGNHNEAESASIKAQLSSEHGDHLTKKMFPED